MVTVVPDDLDELGPDVYPPPPAPDDLVGPGREFWDRVTVEFPEHWRADEARLLLDACRAMNLVDRLEAGLLVADLEVTGSTGQLRLHPFVAEIRAQRLALGQLMRGLDLRVADADGQDDERLTPSEAGRRAAMVRWTKSPSRKPA